MIFSVTHCRLFRLSFFQAHLAPTALALVCAAMLSACATQPKSTINARIIDKSNPDSTSEVISTNPTPSTSTVSQLPAIPAAETVTPHDASEATAHPIAMNTSTVPIVETAIEPDKKDVTFFEKLPAMTAEVSKDIAKPTTDLWVRIRAGFAIPDLQNTLVSEKETWYAAKPDYFQRMVERSSRYLYHVVEELEKRHMPTELALLPFIESAFNPQALSSAKAAGMWQFIPSTGKDYNLTQNMFRDERRDVVASTTAALDYLSKLYDMFGDWQLALAAYNWGEGAVSRAIEKNQRLGLATHYMALNMPAETRHYFPKLQAVKNLIANPDAFDIALPTIPNHPYFVTLDNTRDMDIVVAARLANLPLEEFKALNPAYNRPVIVGAINLPILLPYENAQIFQKNLSNALAHDVSLSSWTSYTLNAREPLESISKKLNVSVAILRDVNHIPPRMRLKAGSTILVPKPRNVDTDISEHVAENAVMAMEPDTPEGRRIVHRVSRGETLSSIAARYRMSVAQLQALNPNRKPQTGQMLVIRTTSANTAVATKVSNKSAPVMASNKNQPAPLAGKVAVNSKQRQQLANRSTRSEVNASRSPVHVAKTGRSNKTPMRVATGR